MPEATADIRCGDCGAPMRLVEPITRRNADGTPLRFYGCTRYPACRGTHSAHQRTGLPMGIPGDAETRQARHDAHEAFKVVHKPRGPLNRHQAYLWLATEMGISFADCHIGRFAADQCRQVIRLVKGRRWRNWAKDKKDWR